jgi:hypothetical protein
LTEQLATPTVPEAVSGQLDWPNTPVEFEEKLTDPAGLIFPPTSGSVTVATQLVAVLFVAGLGEQETFVEVDLFPTLTFALLELELWLESPP